MVDEPETNRDFIATLVNLALTKYNADKVRICSFCVFCLLSPTWYLICLFGVVREQAWNWERF